MRFIFFFLILAISLGLSYSLETSYSEEKNKIIKSYFVSDSFANKSYSSIDNYISKQLYRLNELGVTSISLIDENQSILISKSKSTDYSFINYNKKIILKNSPLQIKFFNNNKKLKISSIEYTLSSNFSFFYLLEFISLLVYFIIIVKKNKFFNNKFFFRTLDYSDANDKIKNITNVDDFFKIDDERFNVIRDKAVSLYIENEKKSLWKIHSLQTDNDKIKKENSASKNQIEFIEANGIMCIKELKSLSYLVSMLSHKLDEICGDKSQRMIVDSVLNCAKNIDFVVRFQEILSEKIIIHQSTKLNIFNEINQMIEDNHVRCENKNIVLSYFSNNDFSEENHGYGKSISFIIGYILKEVVEFSSIKTTIDIRTIIFSKDGNDYIRFKFNLTGGNNLINSNKENIFKLIIAISNKYSDRFDICSVENYFNGTFDTEIVYETKCSMSLFKKNRKLTSSSLKIGVYDKNISVVSKISSSLETSGFICSSISSLKDISTFDLIFIENYNPNKKDHNYLLNSNIKLCSVENEINHKLLNIKRSTTGLYAAISYTSKIKDYKDVIKMATVNSKRDVSSLISEISSDKNKVPLVIQNLLAKSKKKNTVIILTHDLDFNRSISTILNSSDILDVIDIDFKSFDDIENIINLSPSVIIIDDQFNINGDNLSVENFQLKLRFNHVSIALCEDINDIKYRDLCDYYIYKRSKLIIDEIISISNSQEGDINYEGNIIRLR
jgi:hypothetical protein